MCEIPEIRLKDTTRGTETRIGGETLEDLLGPRHEILRKKACAVALSTSPLVYFAGGAT